MSIEDRAQALAERAVDGIIGAIERARKDRIVSAAYWYYLRDEQAKWGPRWLRPLRRAQRRIALARFRAKSRAEGVTCPA